MNQHNRKTVEVPQNLEDVTAAWLGQVLREAGVLESASDVAEIATEPLAGNIGNSGNMQRLRPVYKQGVGAPSLSMILKIPTSNPVLRPEIRRVMRLGCQREARFYKELAPQCPVSIPKHYFAGVGLESGAVLIEDLSHLTPGDQVVGCRLDEATTAMECIAMVHAKWWHDPSLKSLVWLGNRNHVNDADPPIHARYKEAWKKQLDREGHQLSSKRISLGERLVGEVTRVEDELAQPTTLIHADFRADNLLFSYSTGRPEVTLIDWQMIRHARPGVDTSRFLSESVDLSGQDASIEGLIRHYVHVLHNCGVTDYRLDEAVLDCRLGVLERAYMSPFSSLDLDNRSERSQAFHRAVRERLAVAIEELDPMSLLDQLT